MMKINASFLRKWGQFVALIMLTLLTKSSHAQWSSATLSEPRYSMSATSAGSKAFFAGGDNDNKVFKTVDIYDLSTNSWSTDSLSEPRVDLAAVSLGNKVFFAGGFTGTEYSTRVDIYDVQAKTWKRSNLSEPRTELSAVSLGTKVYFAGGRKSGGLERSDVIDIYDTNTGKWTSARLSDPRCKLAAASVGTKVFFGGGLRNSRAGFSNSVDIYDAAADTWTVYKLSVGRHDLTAASVGNKVFFAGGLGVTGESDIIDIYDNATNSWTMHRLSQGRFDLVATTVGDKVFFAGGHTASGSVTSNVVDIYDDRTQTWSTTTLSEARNSIAAASVGSKAIFAGGWGSIFHGPLNVVDIYDVAQAATDLEPPDITLVYRNEGLPNVNGKFEVEIRVKDLSLIPSVIINNVEYVSGDIRNQYTFFNQFSPGEAVLVKARDESNHVTGLNFAIKSSEDQFLSTSKTKGRYYALLMAVEKYSDQEIEQLNEPVKDAKKLKDLLEKKYDFNSDDITFLQNPSFDDINIAFETLTTKITPKDLVLIFYAGHGFFDEKTNIGYWLPSDATQKNKARWFRNSALVENIRSINSKHTLLIADACFSGGIFKTRAAHNNASVDIANMLRRTSRKAITSGALNTVPDESIFMKYLLKTLEENRNQYLPAEDLYDDIRQAMRNNSDLKPGYGEIQNTGDEGGNFVFIQRN